MKRKTAVHTPTSNLDESKDFYSRLRFELLSEDDPTMFTDGKALVEINPDRFARTGIKIYSEDLAASVSELGDDLEVIEIGDGFLLSDPNGVWVYVIDEWLEVDHQVKEKSFGLPGNFVGLSIEGHDIHKTAEFWSALGFRKKEGDLDQGWATFSDDEGFDISLMKPLMCPHLFFNPGMTYFNGGKNLTNIGLLREAGIPITEEITIFSSDNVADNVIIRDPGGLGFFIFND